MSCLQPDWSAYHLRRTASSTCCQIHRSINRFLSISESLLSEGQQYLYMLCTAETRRGCLSFLLACAHWPRRFPGSPTQSVAAPADLLRRQGTSLASFHNNAAWLAKHFRPSWTSISSTWSSSKQTHMCSPLYFYRNLVSSGIKSICQIRIFVQPVLKSQNIYKLSPNFFVKYLNWRILGLA